MRHEDPIFITGGCGFIGSNFVRHCLVSGYNVVNLDKLTYAGNRMTLSDIEGNPAYDFVEGDIGDIDLVSSLLLKNRPQAVLHLAAESHVDRSIDAPEKFVQTNIVGTSRLLAAILDHFKNLDEPGKKHFVSCTYRPMKSSGHWDRKAISQKPVRTVPGLRIRHPKPLPTIL